MKYFALALLLAAPAAQANTVIDASSDAAVIAKPGSIELKLERIAAARLFDALTVTATPGWEDVQISSKSAAGLYCNNEDAPAGRETSCQIEIDPAKGILNAAPRGSAAMVVSLMGEPARKIYEGLSVQAVAENAEGFDWGKSLPGISCQMHRVATDYDCVIVVDPALGILW